MKQFDIERMCRVDGKQPTLREKWVDFFRIYRIAMKHGGENGGENGQAVGECFRVLYSDWRWIKTAESRDKSETVSMVTFPKFIRRRLLKLAEKKRLHGERLEWLEKDMAIANQMRQENGIEMTPGEVAEARKEVFRKAREYGREKWIKLPADDEELLDFLRRCKE